MGEVLNALYNRRSVRQYTGDPIPQEKLDEIIEAGLVSESARNQKAFELIVVRDRELLDKMSQYRGARKNQLSCAAAAIVVVGIPSSDTWVEDCVIAMANMHLTADSIGVGSCFMQGRMRGTPEQSADNYLRGLLGYPEDRVLEGVLSLGMPASRPDPHTKDELLWDKVHFERY